MRASRARTPLLPAVTQNPAHNAWNGSIGAALWSAARLRPRLVRGLYQNRPEAGQSPPFLVGEPHCDSTSISAEPV